MSAASRPSPASGPSNDPLFHQWMPFTANRQFLEQPRIIARAEGVYYYNTQGQKLLDGSSGLYCIPLGHGRREIREAVAKQMEELDYAPPFQYGVPAAFRLATELTQGDARPMEDERIETKWFTRKELRESIRTNKITDAKTMIGLLYWDRL